MYEEYDDDAIAINPQDIRVDIYGDGINKIGFITHLPTGVRVQIREATGVQSRSPSMNDLRRAIKEHYKET